MSELLLTTLLVLMSASPRLPCLLRRRADIAQRAEASATAYGVPPGLLLVVGFLESHLGCAPASGGCWGAPVSRTRRGVAGTSDHAASALTRGYEVCGSWLGAVSRFRCGRCHCPTVRGYSPAYAIRLVRRVYARTGVPIPGRLR